MFDAIALQNFFFFFAYWCFVQRTPKWYNIEYFNRQAHLTHTRTYESIVLAYQ